MFLGAPSRQVASEEILRLDPEVIIAAWCGAGDRVPLEKIISSRGWQATVAATNGRVYCIRDEYLNTPAPTLLQGLDALLYAIHPELLDSAAPPTKGIRQITGVSASTVSNTLR
jgi:iron complex transport system substrate-binding protein